MRLLNAQAEMILTATQEYTKPLALRSKTKPSQRVNRETDTRNMCRSSPPDDRSGWKGAVTVGSSGPRQPSPSFPRALRRHCQHILNT
ncbi:hypothetical protein EYF80_015032 [Liparis tanakae]|uniref:Uncharacterized protein n=1 Tax=Liparis tanakae TaxID=230148 RepID=A0A4Z2IBJ3_9TELE|nr:hypothetical protein EYF80_015032 [Liparis tanakae]